MTAPTNAYDPYHPAAWIAQAQIYGDGFERLCAYPVDALLDAADVSAEAYVLGIGAETGVLRPGGRIALTLWGTRRGAGQDLFRQAREAGGAVLPKYLLRLDPGEDFVRTPEGLVELLGEAGFTATETTELAWDHRTNVERWWGGVLAGIARYGLTMTPQQRETLTRIRDEFDRVCAEFATGEEKLTLPHIAMLGWARA